MTDVSEHEKIEKKAKGKGGFRRVTNPDNHCRGKRQRYK